MLIQGLVQLVHVPVPPPPLSVCRFSIIVVFLQPTLPQLTCKHNNWCPGSWLYSNNFNFVYRNISLFSVKINSKINIGVIEHAQCTEALILSFLSGYNNCNMPNFMCEFDDCYDLI